jgi:hypothetical protein
MKFQVNRIENGHITKTIIVEAKNEINAAKMIIENVPAGEKITAKKAPKRGDNVYGVGSPHVYEWLRWFVTVTPVVEVATEVTVEVTTETVEVTTETVEVTTETVEVATTETVEVATTETVEVSIEETATATMMTYTDAQLMDIVTSHSLRNSKVDRILTEAATRELAGR